VKARGLSQADSLTTANGETAREVGKEGRRQEPMALTDLGSCEAWRSTTRDLRLLRSVRELHAREKAESPYPRTVRCLSTVVQKVGRSGGPGGSVYAAVRTCFREVVVAVSYMLNSCSSKSILVLVLDILSCKPLTLPWYLLSTTHLKFCRIFDKKPEFEALGWNDLRRWTVSFRIAWRSSLRVLNAAAR
jgi:hypothetical protein